MKKIIVFVITIMLTVALAACGSGQESANTVPVSTPTPEPSEQSTPVQTSAPEESQSVEDIVYEFEFSDLDGTVHKLSDYRGQPVYLRVWASWCSVCLSSLDKLDALAGEDNDFAVLSVVMPDLSGEKSAEDFTKWYKDLGYKNLTVLLDPDGQIVYDFGINAFPSQIMFDAEGHIAYGVVGLMDTDLIKQTMEKIAAGDM